MHELLERDPVPRTAIGFYSCRANQIKCHFFNSIVCYAPALMSALLTQPVYAIRGCLVIRFETNVSRCLPKHHDQISASVSSHCHTLLIALSSYAVDQNKHVCFNSQFQDNPASMTHNASGSLNKLPPQRRNRMETP